MPFKKPEEAKKALNKIFSSKEEDLTPELLELIETSHLTFAGDKEIVVLPAQNGLGVGKITAEVRTLTNKDMWEIEQRAQGVWPALRAADRTIKLEKLLRMVQRVHYLGSNNVEPTILDFTDDQDGEVLERGFFEHMEQTMFERFYKTCVEGVESHIEALISKVLAENALLLKKS